MPAVLVRCHVQIYYVTFLERSSVWDSMADDLVDTCAARARKSVVVERRRVRPLRQNKLMHNSVDFFGGDAWGHRSMPCIQGLPRNLAHGPQLVQVVFVVDYRHFLVCQGLKVLVGLAGACIVGLANFGRHLPSTFEGVGVSAHGSSITTGILTILNLLFVRKLVEFPKASKAFLAAKESWFEGKFNACWTLHCGFFGAIWRRTRSFGRIDLRDFFFDFFGLVCVFNFFCHFVFVFALYISFGNSWFTQ